MFKIEVEFKDWWMGRHEFKTESTDSWYRRLARLLSMLVTTIVFLAKSFMIMKSAYWTIRHREVPLKN